VRPAPYRWPMLKVDSPRVPHLVTVAIPVRNGAHVIAEQLSALSAQDYAGAWELLVVDNGSTDDTVAVVEATRSRFASLRIVSESRPGIGPARNRALAEAGGELMAICDADDVVQPGWLRAMVSAAADNALVGGRCRADLISPTLVVTWRGELPADRLPRAIDAHPFAPGGNCAVWVDVAKSVGGWDESFVAGADDVDFSWRIAKAGHNLGFAPDAVLAYRYRDGLRALVSQFFRYGVTEVPLHRRHLDWDLRTYRLRDLLAVWWALARRTSELRSQPQRGIWLRDASYHAGRLVGSVRNRHLLP
jgi:glycosyltransferase involved in cell wall biosynthesis